MNDKQKAEALRLAATYLGSGLHDNAVKSLQRQANALDPPKVDRSLRGWVMVVVGGKEAVYWAEEDRLYDFRGGLHHIKWEQAENRRFKVTKLHTLQPDEVAVKIPPVSEWPHGCEFIRIALLFESATGRKMHESFDRILNREQREQAERMEAE